MRISRFSSPMYSEQLELSQEEHLLLVPTGGMPQWTMQSYWLSKVLELFLLILNIFSITILSVLLHTSNFVVDDSPNLGFNSVSSTMKISGTQKKIKLVALRERGDKTNSKILQFSHTELNGALNNNDQLNGYIGMRFSYGCNKKFLLCKNGPKE